MLRVCVISSNSLTLHSGGLHTTARYAPVCLPTGGYSPPIIPFGPCTTVPVAGRMEHAESNPGLTRIYFERRHSNYSFQQILDAHSPYTRPCIFEPGLKNGTRWTPSATGTTSCMLVRKPSEVRT